MQLPGEEDADGAVDMEGEAKKLGVVQLVFEVYTQTWGELFNRPFVLVRRLKRANRGATGRRGYEACEKRATGHYKGVLLDQEGVKDKLGVLWTWETCERGGACKVLPGSQVLQSVPMMPHFKPGTAEYSMDIGMYAREPVQAGQQGAPAVQNVQLRSPGLKNCSTPALYSSF